MPPRPPFLEQPAPADFIRAGDYVDRYLSDVAAALPRAPLTVLESLWWYATGRGVRARNRLQEIVGRRLGFARPNRLRPLAGPSVPASRRRFAAIIPVAEDVAAAAVEATLASVPDGIDAVVASSRSLELSGRTRLLAFPEAVGIAALVRAAAETCDHDVVLILLPGNVLLGDASDRIAAAFAVPGVEAAFCDEVMALPGLTLPLLKPDFDEDLLSQVDYVGDFLAVARQRFLALGGYDATQKGMPARDFLMRLSASRGAEAVGHILGVIHGRDRRAAAEVAGGNVVPGPGIVRPLADLPPVSVIVPTRDRADLLAPSIEGLLNATDYTDLEIIVADNESSDPATLALFARYADDPRVRIAPMPGPFNFSRINNDAVVLARGRVLVFMNNDVEVLEPGWLRALVGEAVRPDIGAVGAKLLYPGGLVQHAGVVLGLIGGPAGHAFHLFKDGHPGYLHMLETTRRVSAVTAACLAVTRDKFDAVGGFDADAFPVALNDVDLCLRLDQAGYRNLYVPVRLLHKESASRPNDMRPDQRARYEGELAAFSSRWAERLRRDRWYNAGHGQANPDFSVPQWTGAWPPGPR